MHRRTKQTQGTETSQYLVEEKANAIPSVAASERGTAQTGLRPGVAGTDVAVQAFHEFGWKAGPEEVTVL